MTLAISRRRVTQLLGGAGLACLSPLPALAAARGFAVSKLRVEWQAKPMAVDTLRPRFHWTLRADAKARGVMQSAFRLVVVTDDAQRRSVSDTGKTASKALRFQAAADLPLRPQSRYIAQLTVWDETGAMSAPFEIRFATGLFAPSDNRAKWIAGEADDPNFRQSVGSKAAPLDKPKPLPRFRRGFDLAERPVAAHAVVVGLGHYQFWLNGRKISPDGLNGHWTTFDKRVAYDGYDLTPYLSKGSHSLSVALGNGFFKVEAIKGRYTKLTSGFGPPQMWLQLRLVYADGREEFIVSDETWKVCDSGTTLSSIYAGEDFDARIDASPEWRSALAVKGPAGKLEAGRFMPMKVQRVLKSQSVKPLASGALVYDLGLNHSGWPQITLRNTRPGQIVRIVPAEIVTEDGAANQQSMVGGSRQGYRGIDFNYTCRGGASETWEPQFTYTGYRYLQIEGASKAQISAVGSVFLYDDLAEAGVFTCSDKNMEAIHGLIKQALLSNMASVITDCPHREKLGWLEQIYLNAATAMMNVDAVALYEKMTADMRDSQFPSGLVPTTAPEYLSEGARPTGTVGPFQDSPEWGAALILATWYVFRLYGDQGILEQNYAAMQARAAYMQTRLTPDGLIDFGLGDWYDIGPKKAGQAQLTSKKMTGTATYILELETLSAIAGRLGKPEAAEYAQRAKTLKLGMQKALFDPSTSRFDTGSQTAQAMAIVLDLLPDGHKQKALEVLIADIRSRNDHVTAGDIGFHYVVRALSDNGRADILYAMLSRTDKPAYLEQVKNGATALTEAWDSSRESSQNHFMLGHAELWFWSGLGGVNVDLSSAEPLVIAPQPVAGVQATEVSYDSVFGMVRSGLSRDGQSVTLKVEVPVGSTALVRVPCTDAASLRESGKTIGASAGILSQSLDGDAAVLRIGSGAYTFTATHRT